MSAWRRSSPSIQDERLGLTRRRFLRAAGVGTAGAVVAAGAVAGQAGAEPDGPAKLAVAIPLRRRRFRPGADGTAAVQAVSGPLSLHTITPKRYLDTRSDGGGPFGPNEGFIFDFGHPEYFGGGVPNEVPSNAQAIACNLTVTGGTAGGNLRAFPADVAFPQVANLNWLRAQTVGNFATVGAAIGPDGQGGEFHAAVVIFSASNGSVHVIVDIFGYYV